MNSQENIKPGDGRFFSRSGPFSLQKICETIGIDISCILPFGGGIDLAGRTFSGVAPLQNAGPDEISFLDNRRYLPLLSQSRAGAVILGKVFADKAPKHALALPCAEPYLAWSRVARLFYPPAPVQVKRHATAIIADTASIAPNVEIGAFTVIGENVRIGEHCVIGSHVNIGDSVEIGAKCRIASHVTLSHSLLGEAVILYPGVRVGQDGFGFAPGPNGFENVPQLGLVIIGDFVEIGANSTIDRGSMQNTIIGAGTRIDNLVQIGHNVQMGRCCIIVAQAGISGSTILGDFVTVAAQAGLTGHLKIGQKARIGAQCGVMSDVEAGADVIGSPAMPFREFFRNVATLRKLSRTGIKGQKSG